MELASDRVADLVSAFGTRRIGPSLLNLFEPQRGIVHGVAFERHGDAPPSVLFAAARDPQEHAQTADMVRTWTASDYRIDPVLERLDAVAPCDGAVQFCDARGLGGTAERECFIERYYRRHDLGEEVDFVVREGQRLLVLSLCRRGGDGSFNGRERESLAGLAPLMLACARQCAQRRETPAPSSPPPQAWSAVRAERLARLRDALRAASGRLTEREADVCAHIVMGYSAAGIGLKLGISSQTVASHRKHAYAKLGVCSQAGLFELWHRAAERDA